MEEHREDIAGLLGEVYRPSVSTGGSGDVETGSDRKFPISPTLPRIISESRSFSFSESIFLKS